MARNVKPLLTILIDEDKRLQLREFAADKNVSMGWLINRLIDRLLIGDVDLFNDSLSISASREPIGITSIGLDRDSIELMIKDAIDTSSINTSQGINQMTATISLLQTQVELLREDVEWLKLDRSIANITAPTSPDPVNEVELEDESAPISQGLEISELPLLELDDKPSLPTPELIPDSTTAAKPPNGGVRLAIARLERETELKARVFSGVAQGFKGDSLRQWLADDGFTNDGKGFSSSSLSHLKAACERMKEQLNAK